MKWLAWKLGSARTVRLVWAVACGAGIAVAGTWGYTYRRVEHVGVHPCPRRFPDVVGMQGAPSAAAICTRPVAGGYAPAPAQATGSTGT